MLQAYVANQGDGWTYTLEYLQRHLEQHRTTPASDALPANAHEAYLDADRGCWRQRTAELHRALARPRGMPRFDPEPLTRADIDAYRQRALGRGARRARICWPSNLEQIPPPDRRARHRSAGPARAAAWRGIEAMRAGGDRRARRSASTATITSARCW